MAKVFLRVYNREIESMIEGGQLDEAVAHCQYILKAFPMHVDTYRLLGKAFLEARRYSDAADIFQRVLMAVPDDFVSHVGMSIIRDDENKLDDAIWHMERAFEVQPSNSAIQGELRRLYGRRDGVEPSKIRLSRDALANMYSQGELFNQAIAEIRSVLAEDNNRPDLQVMLARAYYHSGQKVEAAEMAATLLKKYPYCMDALRILVDVLPGTARAENTQVYRQRLHNLDPYSSFTVNSVFTSDQVVDSAVSLERLDYKSEPAPISSQPDWASSLGIKLNEEKRVDAPPAWLQTTDTQESAASSSSQPAEATTADASAHAEASNNVPEWMRSAGWQEANNAEESSSVDSGESHQDASIAKADLPDWIRSMAPEGAVEEGANQESEEPAEALPIGEDGIPEWLKPAGTVEAIAATALSDTQPSKPQATAAPEILEPPNTPAPVEPAGQMTNETQQPVGAMQTETESQQVAESLENKGELPSQGSEEVPDWLKSISLEKTVEEAPAEPPQQPAVSQQEPVENQAVGADATPDWLKSLASEGRIEDAPVQETTSSTEPEEKPVEPEPVNEAGVPDWFKEIAPAKQAKDDSHQAPVESQKEPIEIQHGNEGEIPGWLKDMTPIEPDKQVTTENPSLPPQQPVGPEPAAADEVPDWLRSLDSGDVPAQENAESEPAAEAAQAHVEPVAGDAGDVLDWLRSLDSGETPGEAHAETAMPTQESQQVPEESPASPVETEHMSTEPAPESKGEIPDWFKSLTSTPPMEEMPAVSDQPPAEPHPESEPVAPSEASATEPAIELPVESQENVPDWLKSIAPVESAEVSKVSPAEAPAEPSAEPAAVGTEPTPIPTNQSTERHDSILGRITGMGSRADAAAVSAIAMEQALSNKQPLPETPVPLESPAKPPETPPVQPANAADEAFHPTGEVKPLSIGDDAFSWLESLAAKQGAKPEELLTNPEDRSEEMPEWLRQPTEKPAQEPSPIPQEPSLKKTPIETLPLEPLSRFDNILGSKPAHSIDEAFPVKNEAASPEPPVEPVSGQAIQPSGVEESTTDWLRSLGTEAEQHLAETPINPAETEIKPPDWLHEDQEAQPVVSAVEEEVSSTSASTPAEEETSITSWLSKMDVEEALGKKPAEEPSAPIPASQAEELPDWLKDLEKPSTPVETPKGDSDIPEWLRHPIQSDEPEPIAAPEPATVTEPELPSWVDENAPVTKEAVPTMPEEWLPAEQKTEGVPSTSPQAETTNYPEAAPQVGMHQAPETTPGEVPAVVESAQVNEPLPVEESPAVIEPAPTVKLASATPQAPARVPTLKQTGMLSHIPVQDKDGELLSSAQNVLDQNSLNDSMQKYSKLIKKGRLLDEVIHDLREAIYRYPVDVVVWQTLGDAYMRANRLQDALDAYTKAEELLR